jgi:hypothetical protein
MMNKHTKRVSGLQSIKIVNCCFPVCSLLLESLKERCKIYGDEMFTRSCF